MLTFAPFQLYLAPLDLPTVDLRALVSTLSSDEVRRAVRHGDGSRWAASRGWLRRLIGAYLRCDPSALVFERSLDGKPAVVGADIDFSLSHSGDLAVYAIAQDISIGVDLESLGRRLRWSELATRFYSPAEAARVSRLDPEHQALEFLSEWTRKEAYAKAAGRPLGSLLGHGADDLAVTNFTPAAGYVAAVAAWRREGAA